LFIISTDVSDPQELDPLADATYIRANLTYMPSNTKELPIKTDVLHVNDEVKENMNNPHKHANILFAIIFSYQQGLSSNFMLCTTLVLLSASAHNTTQ